MSVKVVRESVVRYARDLHVYVRSTPLGYGFPDRMFMLNGRVMFMKFVSPGKDLAGEQRRAHEKLAAHGMDVHVVHASATGRQLVERFCYG